MFPNSLHLLVLMLLYGFANAKCVEKVDNYEDNSEYFISQNVIECSVSTSTIGKTLDHFWESTGLCPPDPHDKTSDYLLSEDMHQNLALIGALPHQGLKQVRIHFLLKLISVLQPNSSVSSDLKYNFSLLDKFLNILRDNDLKPGFEIMGNPSNYFSDFENKTQLYEWKDLVKQIALRYIELFGSDYVCDWNFESWNEPSIMFRNHFYDSIKVTPNGYLKYYDACSQGLKEAHNSLIFGGPGDHWPKDIKNGPYVIDLMKHVVNGVNYFTGNKSDTKLDYISLHEKGKSGDSGFIDQQEFIALKDIEKEFPSLKFKPFVENEGDPEAGWDKDRFWRADNTYAATIVQVIARRIHNYNFTNKLSLYGFDHGFLSYYPFQFTQRTLLARFQINNTNPHFTQFVRKPAFAAMGLLAKLGNKLLDVKSSASPNSTFNIIATAYENQNKTEGASDYTILMVNSLDAVRTNGSTQIQFTINLNRNETTTNKEWKWAQYSLDNSHTNPYQLWTQLNCPPFPSDQLFYDMRKQEEPYVNAKPQNFNPINDKWSHTFDIAFPGISLIQICSKGFDSPEKVIRLQAIYVTTNSVLLTWKSSNVRCLKTYELEYSETGKENSFSRINEYDITFPSFQYTRNNKNESTFGHYRIRAVDFWNRKSPDSDVLNWVSSV